VLDGRYTLVCGGDDWPQGIVGLVAGKLAQAYHRPSLVYSIRDGVAGGSGRSISGFDLLGALRTCDPLFDRYGGHQAAAGFSLAAERLDALRDGFELAARATLTPEQLQPVLHLDGYLRPATVSYDFAQALERLAPFGAGFTAPTFGLRGVRVTESRRMGADGAHWRLRLRLDSDSPSVEAVFFGGGALAEQFPPRSLLDAAFNVKRRRYDGYYHLELELLDVATAA
jgi:single-stranded-DNA-specific exonuclease